MRVGESQKMRFTRFEIENFKGIKSATLDFSKLPDANVFTLVGLNESGKTTVLEAINSFMPDIDGAETLYQDIIKTLQFHDLVPKAKKANFTGNIVVKGSLSVNDEDRRRISDFCRTSLKCSFDRSKLQEITISRVLTYEDSNYVKTSTYWYINIWLKKGGERKFKRADGTSDDWQKLVRFIGQEILPRICYFPTFLFNFPERIYLSNAPRANDTPANAYYVQIVQDVLDSLGEGLDIKKHIVQRIERTIKPDTPWNMFGFLKSDDKQQIDHVMLKIGARITEEVFSRWNEIFGIKIQDKTIDVDWEIEENEAKKPAVYLKFWIRDGHARFGVAERSLGFRWFFCFLLFTQFRISRKNSSALFLFDEPASNLHSRAQEQLLKSFSKISTGNHMTLYSTHSHYMIEPRWLEGAFIVSNDAVVYDEDPSFEVKRKTIETNIRVDKYRDFVGQNPTKVTYFQPILDKLDYAPSKLELVPRSVFVEGKNDFYMLSYFKDVIFSGTYTFRIVPSVGANDLGPLISLYLGWGRRFLALLDADKAGHAARDRYRNDYFLSESDVLTIDDILPALKNAALEKILSEDGRSLIATEMAVAKLSKKDIARFFQEKFAQSKKVAFDQATLDTVQKLLKQCAARLA